MTAPSRLTDRKRQAILTAAADQFRANGFEASSMDKIAASAGVSKRTVYNHFPSKEDLFAETLIELYSGSATILEVPYRSDAPLREQLTALMALKAASMADPQFLALSKVAIAEAVHAPERVRPLVARLGEREQGVTTWIRAAQADGRIKAGDPEFAAALLQGQVKALAFWPQMTLDVPPLTPAQQAALVEAAVSMFLSYFAVANETA
jgi:TetR/AcrR family transcriptional regulator of autoinduction and epiphytic fitness